MSIECQSCGGEVNPEPAGGSHVPCPTCGATAISRPLAARDQLSLSDGIGVSQVYAHTGREEEHFTEEQRLAHCWARQPDRAAILNHPVADCFENCSSELAPPGTAPSDFSAGRGSRWASRATIAQADDGAARLIVRRPVPPRRRTGGVPRGSRTGFGGSWTDGRRGRCTWWTSRFH